MVTDTDKAAIIAAHLASPGGRAKLAASMVAPLRARLDYQSVARNVFAVEQLPSGAAPIFDGPEVPIPPVVPRPRLRGFDPIW